MGYFIIVALVGWLIYRVINKMRDKIEQLNQEITELKKEIGQPEIFGMRYGDKEE